jgi:hypothetical protein
MKLGTTIAALALSAGAALIPAPTWAQNDAPPNGLSAQDAAPSNSLGAASSSSQAIPGPANGNMPAPSSSLNAQAAGTQLDIAKASTPGDSSLTTSSLSTASQTDEILPLAPRTNNLANITSSSSAPATPPK